MKELIIYLHTTTKSETRWLQELSRGLSNSLERFEIQVISITNQKEAFFNAIGGNKIGCYLPIINQNFLNSSDDSILFQQVVDDINNQFSDFSFHFSLIEEVLPINQANYQPLYKFFNQGDTSSDTIRRPIEEYLPGKNTPNSFYNHINNIAKEISYQILRVAAGKNITQKVFISTTTSDLKEPVNSLYNFLLENNIEVTAPVNAFGYGEKLIEDKISNLMQNCWLSIHPFGNGKFGSDSYLENHVNLCEIEDRVSVQVFHNKKQSDDTKLRRIIWIPKLASSSTYEGRMIERIRNSAVQKNNAEILDCSFEELKEIILSYHKGEAYSKIGSSPQLFKEKKVNFSSGFYDITKNSVLVLFEAPYSDLLEDVKSTLEHFNLKMVTLKDIESEPDFPQAKNKILKNCTGVLLLSSNWNTNWFKSNINEIVKAKSLRSNKPFSFLCMVSKEVEQLPSGIYDEIILLKLNGSPLKGQLQSLLENRI